jgi:hypothetical protein
MSAREVLEEYLPEVASFITEIETTEDDEERELQLSKVRSLVKFLTTFYVAFLAETLDVQVRGFSYKDKRKVSQCLVKAEIESAPGDSRERALELAARFEDLSDLFHGDVDFGYAEDPDAYMEFHTIAFPEWLDSTEKWLRTEGDQTRALADKLDDLWKRYTDAIS